MNEIGLLMGLLVLSYVGGFLVGGRTIRGFGLPSGTEFLVLGFLLGPQLLGLFSRDMIDAFEPVAQVALAWLALVIGVELGRGGHGRVSWRRMVLSFGLGLATWTLVSGTVYACVTAFTELARLDRLLLAGGVGAACTQTTRHAVRWVVERHRARGPLSDLIGDLADSDDLVPLLALTVLFSLAPPEGGGAAIPPLGWIGLTAGLGVVLGVLTSMLLAGPALDEPRAWAVLLGTSLLAIGLAAHVSLSQLSVTFFMGVAIAATSRHETKLREMLISSERPVMLPALLLGGARVDWHATEGFVWIAIAAIAARFLAKLASGALIAKGRASGPQLGLGMVSSGALAIGVGLAFAFRFPGAVGDTVLATAAISIIAGEFVGPGLLRRALASAGELEQAPAEASP